MYVLLSDVQLFADPMDCSMPGFPFLISQSLLKVMLTESVILSVSSFVVPFSSFLQSFPESGSFPMSDTLYQVVKIF